MFLYIVLGVFLTCIVGLIFYLLDINEKQSGKITTLENEKRTLEHKLALATEEG